MKDWTNVLVSADATLREAMLGIDAGGLQLAILVTPTKQLVGVLSDGDVRRAILRGEALDIPARQVANASPITALQSTSKQALLGLMRQKSLHHIPLVDETQHVVGLATLDELTGIFERPNWVVLMAGGEGIRLRPLTENCPKPLLRIGNKPILETIIEQFAEQGFRRFYISINYMAEAIRHHFGDGSDWGVEIVYLHEKDRLGTAGGLSLLPGIPEDPILVMNGDLLTTMKFDQLLHFHDEHQAQATMTVREYEYQIPYGVVDVAQHQLTRLEEKPVKRHFVSAGIYALSPSVLKTIPKETYYDITSLFEALLVDKQRVSAYPMNDYWLDIGRMDEFERAQQDWMQGVLT